ncbi:helix-turn-helix domain-containing protein [Streptomyces sp. NPDC052107]|uniref:helix-turn-helix domain-containing protein n=1 Tax=Streptomyces sp. NPDC052107 TaxID=3155632 RepID=UPI0034217306
MKRSFKLSRRKQLGDHAHPVYAPTLSLDERYAVKASELGVTDRTVRRWVANFRRHGEAGLVQRASAEARPLGGADDRRVETALRS